MSSEVASTQVPAGRRTGRRNYITFPRELRDAIPELHSGRILDLDSTSAATSRTLLYGPRVHLKLVARTTGKQPGEFNVLVDLLPDAARALGETLLRLAHQAEVKPTHSKM